MVDYLDVLDDEGVPQDERVLAALGPKVLRLARDRTAGAHPYLVPPEHTRIAREALGDGVFLAPEQKIVARDRSRLAPARSAAPPSTSPTSASSTTPRTCAGSAGATRTSRAPAATSSSTPSSGWGDAPAAAARIRAHLDAGADHVPVKLLTEQGADPLPGYRAIAEQFA